MIPEVDPVKMLRFGSPNNDDEGISVLDPGPQGQTLPRRKKIMIKEKNQTEQTMENEMETGVTERCQI